MDDGFRLGVIQASPIWLDTDASTNKACDLIAKAGVEGVTVAAFGETWLPGYPIHTATQIPGIARSEIAAAYLDAAVEIPSPTTEALCDAAREAEIDVVIGIAEKDPSTQGSVYCTMLWIGADGAIVGKHRKLKPTAHERMAWADGDASGLRVHQRPYGRVSAMNCWEHNMILPGYVLVAEGTQIHVAAWPGGEPEPPSRSLTRQTLLSRAFASQAGAYVILAAGMLLPDQAPERFRDVLFPLTGQSAIIDPFGEVIAGPADGETMLVAEGSLATVRAAKAAFDAAGHYSRPDIFSVTVDRAQRQSVDALHDPE